MKGYTVFNAGQCDGRARCSYPDAAA
jgi:antirestriction protein ArdC